MIVQLDKAIQMCSDKKSDPLSMTKVMGELEHADQTIFDVEEVMSTHPTDEHRLQKLCDQLKKLQNDCVHCNNIQNQIQEKDKQNIEALRKRFDFLVLGKYP